MLSCFGVGAKNQGLAQRVDCLEKAVKTLEDEKRQLQQKLEAARSSAAASLEVERSPSSSSPLNAMFLSVAVVANVFVLTVLERGLFLPGVAVYYEVRRLVALSVDVLWFSLFMCAILCGAWYTWHFLYKPQEACETKGQQHPLPTPSETSLPAQLPCPEPAAVGTRTTAQASAASSQMCNSITSPFGKEPSSAQWINQLLDALWPKISAYIHTTLVEDVQPKIRAALPSILSAGLSFGEVHMGTTPLRFDSMRTMHHTRTTQHGDIDDLHLCVDMVYTGDAKVMLTLHALEVGVSNLTITGPVVVSFPDLLPHPPFFSGLTVYAPDPPIIAMDFRGAADVADWWILKSKVKEIIDTQVANLLVLPNRIVVDLDSEKESDIFRLKRPRPEGLLKLTVVKGSKLKPADYSWKGKLDSSDPFVEVTLGTQLKATNVIPRTLDPVWNYAMNFLVESYSEQHVSVSVFDKDTLSANDLLGRAAVSVRELPQKGDVMLELLDDDGEAENSCKQLGSKLHLHAEWRRFSLDEERAKNIPRGSKEITCLLFVGLYSAKGLPSGKGGSHMCEVEVNAEKQSTNRVLVVMPDTEDTEEAEEKRHSVASKIKKLEQKNIPAGDIAEILSLPLPNVEGYLRNRKLSRRPTAQSNLEVTDACINVKFGEAFVFLLASPWDTVAKIRVLTNTSTSPDGHVEKSDHLVGSEVIFEVERLLEQTQNTEVVKLPLHVPNWPNAKLKARMQLHVLDPTKD